MALPDLVRKTAEKILGRYCQEKSDLLSRCQQSRLAFRIRGDCITLFEERSSCPQQLLRRVVSPVAQFRYHHDLSQWTLHYPAQDNRWRFYLNAGPTLDLGKLVRHLDADPLRLFWA